MSRVRAVQVASSNLLCPDSVDVLVKQNRLGASTGIAKTYQSEPRSVNEDCFCAKREVTRCLARQQIRGGFHSGDRLPLNNLRR